MFKRDKARYSEKKTIKNEVKYMDFCDKPSGFDKALDKRYKIAIDKIRLVKNEEIINREYRELFISLIEFIEKINETYILIRKNKIRELDLTELERINKEAYCNIMEDNYQDSYFNPTYVVEKLGEKVGNSIFVLSSELLYLIEYVYKGKLFEIIIILELFIKVYDCLKAENELSYKLVKQTIYDYYFKHSNIMAEGRIVELIDTEYKFYYDIIMNSDLNDLRYLYYYGKNITDNELRTAKFINGLTDEEVKSMAFAFTEGFRKGFISNNIDLSKKEVVNIRDRKSVV